MILINLYYSLENLDGLVVLPLKKSHFGKNCGRWTTKEALLKDTHKLKTDKILYWD